jgi:hypothetical protein
MANSKISALTAATTPLAGTEVLPVVQSSATTQVTVANLTAGRAVSATQYTSTIATGTAPLVVSSTTNVANLNASSLGGATFAAPGAIGGGTASAITGTTITGTDTTDATSTTAAALKTAGGLAVVKKTYIGDNIVQGVAAKGINFTANTPAAGMTSQLLNWYEEGTWTPTVSALTGAITSYTATGAYTRIGRAVTASLKITITNNGTGAVVLKTTLPFTPSSVQCCGAGRENNVTGVGVIIINDASVNNANIVTVTNTYPGGTGYVITATLTYFV